MTEVKELKERRRKRQEGEEEADPEADARAEAGIDATDKKKSKRRAAAEGGEDGQAQPGAASTRGVVPADRLEDLGGLQRELPIIRELVELPLRYPHLFSRLGADPPAGVLLHGPPGCGKTRLVRALAGSFGVPLFAISAPEVVQGISGDSEAMLRTLFLDAVAVAPSIIFIDEIDTIAGRREDAHREMEKRIVAQLLTCMDQLALSWRDEGKVVCVMGATNRPEAIDPALRRAGRFDREIALGIPTLQERIEILKVLTKTLALAPDVDFFELANMTPGYVGADLHLLVKEAGVIAIRRKYVELDAAGELGNTQSDKLVDFAVTFSDLREATKRVQPSAMREGFTTIPNVSWDDVGALEDAREELQVSILQPIRAPRLHRRFGLDHPIGILLYGPPGCGKTLVAKAIANQSGANFISIKGPELLNKFVGESERSVRMVFARARASAPCVLFFDELDALAPRRGSDRANPSSERVVNQLLTEMDGVDGREGVFVVAATNRPDMIDPAMLRPGRLDKLLYVPLPDPGQRTSILQTVARRFPMHSDVDMGRLGTSDQLDGYSGADLAALVREAALLALKQIYASVPVEMIEEIERTALDASGKMLPDLNTEVSDRIGGLPFVTMAHMLEAARKVPPSVSAADRAHYDKLHAEHVAKRKRQGV
jgi:ribosome biogenesis ATPase